MLLLLINQVDPEARPTIDQLKVATVALKHGTSLPPFEVSNEAKQRRAEREFAQQRRQELKAKKAHNTVPQRAPVQLNPNSAAARRLAAKRGTAAAPVSSSNTQPATTSEKELDFGNFGNFEKPTALTPAVVTQSGTSGQNDGFGSFEVNFDTDFTTDKTNSTSAAHLFSDADDNVQINSAPVTSHAANDLFFSDSDSVPVVSSNQNDGFGNFDNDNVEGQLIASASTNMTSPDAFFSSTEFQLDVGDVQEGEEEEEQHSPFKTDQMNQFEAGFEFFDEKDGNTEASDRNDEFMTKQFGDVFLHETTPPQPPAEEDFFGTASTSGTTTDNPFDQHHEHVPSHGNSNNSNSNSSSGNQNSFDLFGASEETQTQTTQSISNSSSSSSSFQPPTHDPFDMFASPPVAGGGGGSGYSNNNQQTTANANSNSASVEDMFSFSGEVSSSGTGAGAGTGSASKAASVMQMFNNETAQVDPFAQVQQGQHHHGHGQGQGYSHGYQQQGYPQQHGYQQQQQQQQQQPSQQGFDGYQQPQQGSGYGSYQQQQQYGGGGVRQVNPAVSKDPFGSLMGSLK